MFIEISNTPRDYAWGSTTAISDLLGTPETGEPQAELWLGAHPGSPSRIEHPEQADGAEHVAEWIARAPDTATGEHRGLPYLLKVLAAAQPLSLQAHPTLERAREGFARENAEGIPLDAPNRNYRDPLHKPEIIVALSPTFDALCGFRPLAELREIAELLVTIDSSRSAPEWERLGRLIHLIDDSAARSEPDATVLRRVVEWLLGGGDEVDSLVAHIVHLAEMALHPAHAHMAEPYTASLETVVRLSEAYPGDPGIVLSLLLNRVTLKAGEALYLPAGNIHAYLHGLGIELMAASDNVLRGGLTPKHVDVPELLEVLDFDALPVPYLVPARPVPGLQVFDPGVPDFELARVDVGNGAHAVTYGPQGPAIVLCIAGSVDVVGSEGNIVLVRGQAVFVTPEEGRLTFAGNGTVFVAAPGAPAGEIPAAA